MTEMVTLASAQNMVQDKRDLWEAIVRNGIYIPAYGPFITVDYLKGVMEGSINSLKYSEVRLSPCPRPPCK